MSSDPRLADQVPIENRRTKLLRSLVDFSVVRKSWVVLQFPALTSGCRSDVINLAKFLLPKVDLVVVVSGRFVEQVYSLENGKWVSWDIEHGHLFSLVKIDADGDLTSAKVTN